MSKYLLLSLLLTFGVSSVCRANDEKVQDSDIKNQDSGTIKLTVTNVKSDQGSLILQVYNKKESWLEEDESLQKIKVPIKASINNEAVTTEIQLPFGEYALYLFQDRDENDKLKTNWIGIPREPVGTSNNAKGRMGPPKYKDAKFRLDQAQLSLSVKLADL